MEVVLSQQEAGDVSQVEQGYRSGWGAGMVHSGAQAAAGLWPPRTRAEASSP